VGARKPRGSRRAGIAVAAALAAVIGLGLYLFSNSSTPAVDPNNTAPLELALTRVPASDIPGADIPGVPRPGGTVRSYYLSNATVTTVVYTRQGTVDDVRGGVDAGVVRNGWGPVGAATPAAGARSSRTWQQVYSDGMRVLQVELFTHGDVTAAIYVLQKGRSGQ
jgi:hypothetical protein